MAGALRSGITPRRSAASALLRVRRISNGGKEVSSMPAKKKAKKAAKKGKKK
jgi:hypothetical protein